nr:efflux RND transporter periplasmic adaptor subunit [Leptothrix cholodnii]
MKSVRSAPSMACPTRAAGRLVRLVVRQAAMPALLAGLLLPQALLAQADKAATRPALTVTTVTPQPAEWPQTLVANGNVAAWQEAVLGAEIGGLVLTEVAVEVGDRVRRGQVLARLDGDSVKAELAQSRAAVAEAEATLAEARGNADRARSLAPSGVISAQQTAQVLTAEQTAAARLQSARARLQVDELRLRKTELTAPDDGVISARVASVGSVVQSGQELFRLIRQGRLEWRAEVGSADLARLQPGMAVQLSTPAGQRVAGKLRRIAPTVDLSSRNALVYVDLSPGSDARAGMYARGEFALGRQQALTLPAAAVLLRDGFHVVMRLGADHRVSQTKVTVGQRLGERIAVAGLPAEAQVVATGAAFLADGDSVKVVGAVPTIVPAAVPRGAK